LPLASYRQHVLFLSLYGLHVDPCTVPRRRAHHVEELLMLKKSIVYNQNSRTKSDDMRSISQRKKSLSHEELDNRNECTHVSTRGITCRLSSVALALISNSMHLQHNDETVHGSSTVLHQPSTSTGSHPCTSTASPSTYVNETVLFHFTMCTPCLLAMLTVVKGIKFIVIQSVCNVFF
jgi:hypothetical protein